MHVPALPQVTWATYCTSVTLSGLAPGVLSFPGPASQGRGEDDMRLYNM